MNGYLTTAWYYGETIGWCLGDNDFVVRKSEITDETVMIEDELVMLESVSEWLE